MKRTAWAFMFPCLLLAGCMGPLPVQGGPVGPDRTQAEKAEAAQLASVLDRVAKTKSDYRLGPADLLDITVYQDQDLTRKVRVSQNGTVSMPLVGAVKIGGLTILEAEEVLAEKLKAFLVSPQISLFIEEYGNKQVYVLGEVNKPGSYLIPTEGKLSVLEAVSIAGGFTPVAGVDRTRVLRNVNGKSEILTIEVTAITKRGEKDKDIALLPGDTVFVPLSFF